LLKHHIPLKTDHWDMQAAGCTEIDLVAHSGNSAMGEFCYSLHLTDIYTGWTETRAVLGRGQEGVRQALEEIRQALPFPLRGIDSDNGSEFINEHLWRYCQARALQFARGLRHGGGVGGNQCSLLRGSSAVSKSLLLPSVRLAKNVRVGLRLRRRYEAPQTPWQRVVCSLGVDPERMAALGKERAELDPFEICRRIQGKLERISRPSRNTRAYSLPTPSPVRTERPRPPRDEAGPEGDAAPKRSPAAHDTGRAMPRGDRPRDGSAQTESRPADCGNDAPRHDGVVPLTRGKLNYRWLTFLSFRTISRK
jgi:hypothetical protein